MTQSLDAHLIDSEIDAAHLLDHAAWVEARPVPLMHYWTGEIAPPERHADVRALWTAKALHVRFDCRQYEQLVVSDEPQTAKKTNRLWERDVCEIFIAPNAGEPERYFEFEAAPTGEWLDLGIHQMADRRETDWEYQSGMSVISRVNDKMVTVCITIPFDAFGRVPQPNDRWRANLFRCIGSGEGRGYLAWQPTRTELPNFHVPSAFGWLCFVG